MVLPNVIRKFARLDPHAPVRWFEPIRRICIGQKTWSPLPLLQLHELSGRVVGDLTFLNHFIRKSEGEQNRSIAKSFVQPLMTILTIAFVESSNCIHEREIIGICTEPAMRTVQADPVFRCILVCWITANPPVFVERLKAQDTGTGRSGIGHWRGTWQVEEQSLDKEIDLPDSETPVI